MRLIFSSLFHGQECDSFCRLVDFLSSRSIKYFIPLSLLARFLRSRYSPYLCSSVGKVVSFPWLLSKKSFFFFFHTFDLPRCIFLALTLFDFV